MNIIKADCVDLWKKGEWVCVTTNGFVKKDGRAVMGRGNALVMAQVIPALPLRLGEHINKNGNCVGVIYERVISFPVKPKYSNNINDVLPYLYYLYRDKKYIPGFHCKANINIIRKSIEELNDLIEKENIGKVYLPIPGVGAGGLAFEEVKEEIKKINKDKVILIRK